MNVRYLVASLTVLCLAGTAAAQSLASWTFGAPNPLQASSAQPFVTSIGATQGPRTIITTSRPAPSGDAAISDFSFPLGSALDPSEYFQLTVECPAGDCELTGFTATVERDGQGASLVYVSYSTDDFATERFFQAGPYTVGSAPTAISAQLPFPSVATGDVAIRFYPANQATVGIHRFYLGAASIDGQQSVAPLPVEFVSMRATAAGDGGIELSWSTADESDLAFFQAERLTAGGAFVSVGPQVLPKGRTDAPSEYSLTVVTDDITETEYLRVVGIDFDGSRTESATVAVSATPDASYHILYDDARGPHVVSAFAKTLHVYTAGGHLVDALHLTPNLRTPLSARRLPSGIYVVTDGRAGQRVRIAN